jgi:hypothetical protein
MGLLDIFGSKGLVGSITDVLKGLGVLKDPEAELKATQALMAFELQIREADSKQMESVNQTMREEAKSEHFAQWLWRPVVGFTFSSILINNYILLPYFAKYGVQSLPIPGEVWSAMLVILGVAAGTRGLEKWQKEKSK